MNPVLTAKQVLNTLWNQLLPVDIELITKNLGINIEVSNIGINTNGEKIRGKIVMDKNNITIFLDEANFHEDNRFILAYELGHYFLGHGSIEDTFLSLSASTEAFAIELLIPKMAFDLVLDKMDSPTVSKFSKVFNVFENIMYIRLKHSGIL